MTIILVMGVFACVALALLTHDNQYDYEYIEEQIHKHKEEHHDY